ncbi:MAG: MlaD family protein [Solirubrobacteraceae bacterium]
MSGRRRTSIAANPVLVGAVCLLMVVVAVFLSYNANQGLPFVPTTKLNALVPEGGNLLPGNDVKEGGARIGIVQAMKPVRLRDGRVVAEVTMKLDKAAGDIPRDSTIAIRPRSLVGLKYVELTRGDSEDIYADGDTVSVDQGRNTNELDDLQSMYNARTRKGVQDVLQGAGDTLAFRGVSLNQTIEGAPRFLTHLEPVLHDLATKDTQLARFFRELGDAARIVAPVADRYAHGFEAGASAFEAWSRFPDRLEETVRQSRPTLDAGIESLRVQRPFFVDMKAFAGALRRASAVMPANLPRIDAAFRAGIPIQERSVQLNEDLGDTFDALDALMGDPRTGNAFRAIGDLTGILHPLIRFVGPYVTVCNYFNYAFTHVGEHVTEPDPTGTSQRTLLNQAPRPRKPTDPSLGSIGARRPVNGEDVVSGQKPNLHQNLYGAAVDTQGNADCESGQRGYIQRAATYAPATDPEGKPLNIVIDPHIPGNQGPTFTGRPTVPEGQTFSRYPEDGPAFPDALKGE